MGFWNGGVVDPGETDAVEVHSGGDVVDDGGIVLLQRKGLETEVLGRFGGALAAEMERRRLDGGGFDEGRNGARAFWREGTRIGEMVLVGLSEFTDL